MAKYKLTNKAVSDLANIWDYTIETWSENQAEKYYQQLIMTCQNLADNPEYGKHYFEVKKPFIRIQNRKTHYILPKSNRQRSENRKDFTRTNGL